MKKAEQITCKRCGTCCLAGGLALIKDDDLYRWKQEGREDILHIINEHQPVWAGDKLISSSHGELGNGCPFVEVGSEGFSCTIYETRPIVCRNYAPGSTMICPEWKGTGS